MFGWEKLDEWCNQMDEKFAKQDNKLEEIDQNMNARIADVFLATHDIGIDIMIGYTACEQELDRNLVSFGPGSWGLSGTDRNPDVGDPMFVPQEFCSRKKLLVFPPNIFPENIQRCSFYGRRSLTLFNI